MLANHRIPGGNVILIDKQTNQPDTDPSMAANIAAIIDAPHDTRRQAANERSMLQGIALSVQPPGAYIEVSLWCLTPT